MREPTVFVIDDDAGIRQHLQRLFESVRLPVETFPSAHAFLDHYEQGLCGCLLLDLRMPDKSGLKLLEELSPHTGEFSVIMLSAHGDLAAAVEAMKIGAVDFIQKPFDNDLLLVRVQEAMNRAIRTKMERAEIVTLQNRVDHLSPRERQVMDLVVAGKSNKQIAHQLRISLKTVEFHRSGMMEKIGANSVVDLVRMIVRLEGPGSGGT